MHPELDTCLKKYKVMLKLCAVSQQRSHDTTFISRIEIPIVGKKEVRRSVEIYFDEMQDAIEESAHIALVSTFEAVIYEKLRHASGKMKVSLKDNYQDHEPFSLASERFVKDHEVLDSLNKIRDVLKDKIPSELEKKLSEVISYRHRLAHGKRFGEETSLTLENVAGVLDEVIARISNTK